MAVAVAVPATAALCCMAAWVASWAAPAGLACFEIGPSVMIITLVFVRVADRNCPLGLTDNRINFQLGVILPPNVTTKVSVS